MVNEQGWNRIPDRSNNLVLGAIFGQKWIDFENTINDSISDSESNFSKILRAFKYVDDVVDSGPFLLINHALESNKIVDFHNLKFNANLYMEKFRMFWSNLFYKDYSFFEGRSYVVTGNVLCGRQIENEFFRNMFENEQSYEKRRLMNQGVVLKHDIKWSFRINRKTQYLGDTILKAFLGKSRNDTEEFWKEHAFLPK